MEQSEIKQSSKTLHIIDEESSKTNLQLVNSPRSLNQHKMFAPAVKVENAYKSYGNGPPVLNNLNMTVQQGIIYGLLGASGCGKTTMLSCIVGLRHLDRGDINVYGARPGTKESGIPGKTIGYMPQEIALYIHFSIKEILYYFGRIYDMTEAEISSRMEFLVNFLDLPESSQSIDSLSGGQQRRTSLAVAMLHEPELLILDEPTVGVDPLIRENIWEYLCEMVKRRGTTVIITTHYIEEARQSNMVGLMRNGRLLVEKPPKTLLEEYNTNLLEDIVLKLCKKDSKFPNSNKFADEISEAVSDASFYTRKNRNPQTDTFEKPGTVVGLKYKSRSPDYDTLFRQKESRMGYRKQSIIHKINNGLSSHVKKVWALVIKNFYFILRNPLFLIAVLMLPTVQIALTNIVLDGVPHDIEMGLVNKEFADENLLESCLQRSDGCFNANLSCSFINQFEGKFKWNTFSTEAKALESVRLGDSWGFVSIPDNFTEHMKYRSLWKNFISNDTLDGTTISARLDMSDSLQRTILMESIFGNYLGFVKKIATDCGSDPRLAELPLKFNAIYGSLNGKNQAFMQPAQILLIIFLLPMAGGVAHVMDKKAGTLERTMVAGVDFFHILIAKMISEGILIILELAICFATSILLFGFSAEGSWILISLISFMTGITGLSYGFLVGAACSHELEIIIIILGSYMPLLLLSGGTWPLEGNHPLANLLCRMLPAALPIDSFRSIVGRGWGFTHPRIWPGFATLAIWISIFSTFSIIVHKIKK